MKAILDSLNKELRDLLLAKRADAEAWDNKIARISTAISALKGDGGLELAPAKRVGGNTKRSRYKFRPTPARDRYESILANKPGLTVTQMQKIVGGDYSGVRNVLLKGVKSGVFVKRGHQFYAAGVAIPAKPLITVSAASVAPPKPGTKIGKIYGFLRSHTNGVQRRQVYDAFAHVMTKSVIAANLTHLQTRGLITLDNGTFTTASSSFKTALASNGNGDAKPTSQPAAQ